MHAFKAELRKIMTVRSTYTWLLVSFAVGVLLIGFWTYGYKDVEHAAQHKDALLEMLFSVISVTGTLMAFPVLLLVGHEYRYNTILYSLTNTKNRFSMFIAKWVVGVLLAVVSVTIFAALSCLAFYLGQHLHHIAALAQTMPSSEAIWRSLAYVVGGITFAFVIAMLVRSMIASIVIFLLLPSTLEQLLGLVLKDNVRYLPFTALGNLMPSPHNTAYLTSLVVVGLYSLVFGVLAAVLFWRRDAN